MGNSCIAGASARNFTNTYVATCLQLFVDVNQISEIKETVSSAIDHVKVYLGFKSPDCAGEESSSAQVSDTAAAAAASSAGANSNEKMVLLEENCAEMVMELDMNLNEIEGEEEVFKEEIAKDVAHAVHGNEANIHVLSLQPGSIIVQLALAPGVCGEQSPTDVRKELERQAADPYSPLRQGKITRNIKSISITGIRAPVSDFVGTGNLETPGEGEKALPDQARAAPSLVADSEFSRSPITEIDEADNAGYNPCGIEKEFLQAHNDAVASQTIHDEEFRDSMLGGTSRSWLKELSSFRLSLPTLGLHDSASGVYGSSRRDSPSLSPRMQSKLLKCANDSSTIHVEGDLLGESTRSNSAYGLEPSFACSDLISSEGQGHAAGEIGGWARDRQLDVHFEQEQHQDDHSFPEHHTHHQAILSMVSSKNVIKISDPAYHSESKSKTQMLSRHPSVSVLAERHLVSYTVAGEAAVSHTVTGAAAVSHTVTGAAANSVTRSLEKIVLQRSEAGVVGIGLSRQNDTGIGPVHVSVVVPSGPADLSGVSCRHCIHNVDGQLVDGMPLNQIARLLQGDPGSEVELHIYQQNV